MVVSIVPQSHLNGHQQSVIENENARSYIGSLLAGTKPEKLDVGRWERSVSYLEDAFDRDPATVKDVLDSLLLLKEAPRLRDLFFSSASAQQTFLQLSPEQQSNYPELPPEIKAYEARANEASP